MVKKLRIIPAWVLLHRAERWMLTRQCSLQDGNRVSTSVLLFVFSSTFADLGVRGEMELVSRVDTT